MGKMFFLEESSLLSLPSSSVDVVTVLVRDIFGRIQNFGSVLMDDDTQKHSSVQDPRTQRLHHIACPKNQTWVGGASNI